MNLWTTVYWKVMATSTAALSTKEWSYYDDQHDAIHNTNRVESFWKLFKKSIASTHIHISGKYAERYLGEFSFRSNYRVMGNAMFDFLIAALWLNPHSPDSVIFGRSKGRFGHNNQDVISALRLSIMTNPTGESNGEVLRLDFDRRLMLQFHGSVLTSDAGLLAYRELDEALGLTAMAGGIVADAGTGRSGRHALVGMLRQSVFGRLAGYEDVNDAERLRLDPAMRWIVGGKAAHGSAASPSQMGRFETQWLAAEKNLPSPIFQANGLTAHSASSSVRMARAFASPTALRANPRGERAGPTDDTGQKEKGCAEGGTSQRLWVSPLNDFPWA
jgi:Transposase DDE domain group 1/ISXO2-like transposase domain